MLDTFLRPIIDPPLNRIAKSIKILPLSPNLLTLSGLIIGLISCYAAYTQFYGIALILLILNRLCDGLDGPLARAKNNSSDFGGYLDIISDFMIYAGLPFSVAVGLGTIESAIAGCFVLFSIVMAGTSFLAYAIICAKKGMETHQQGRKSFYFSNGLMEGTETIIYLVLICVLPGYFVLLSYIFGILCFLTAVIRVYNARHFFQ